MDKLPTRIAELRTMLRTKGNVSSAILVHCTAGCDRTGEVIGAYRLGTPLALNVSQMYSLDTAECGRSPNYWSTTALEWWCEQLLLATAPPVLVGNCTAFASCKPLKHGQPCTPANATREANL